MNGVLRFPTSKFNDILRKRTKCKVCKRRGNRILEENGAATLAGVDSPLEVLEVLVAERLHTVNDGLVKEHDESYWAC